MPYASHGKKLRSKRKVPRPGLAATLALACLTSGCSHKNPYVAGPTLPTILSPNPALVTQRVLLIGDAGEPRPTGEPVLRALADTAANLRERSFVVFLGDNVYEEGLPAEGAPSRPERERRLLAQMAVADGGARTLFLPGNHDWSDSGPGGLDAVRRQARFVNAHGRGVVHFLADAGCPGPQSIDFGTGVRIVALDTQWWFHDHALPKDECGVTAPAQIADRLAGALREAREAGDYAVVVGHHPVDSRGRHGGFASWQDHIFPLRWVWPAAWVPIPVLGSLYPLVIQPFFTPAQDLRSDPYDAFQHDLRRAFAAGPPLVYAAGHEHSLQVFRGEVEAFSLVSGAGSAAKITSAGHGDRTLLSHSHVGFMVLDFLADGRVLLRVIEPTESGDDEPVVFSRWLVEEPGPAAAR